MILTALALIACPVQAVLQPGAGVAEAAALPPFDAGPDAHRNRVIYDAMPDGTIWARGRDYKASADAEGFTFIPFLGSNAPHNFPVRMRLASMRRGVDSIALGRPSKAQRSADRIVLDRGSVRVRYDLAPDGVEQSFAIDAAHGTGDLILSIEVDTELQASPENGGFQLFNERGGVKYGAATVFDAASRQAAVPAEWSSGRIHLSVPASFLDTAGWPILIDPLLTPFQIASSTADLLAPDVAFDPALPRRYVVVAEERFSATDSDVLTWYVATDGTAFGAAYIDQTTDSWETPRVSVKLGSPNGTHVLAVAPSASIAGATDIVWRERELDASLRPPLITRSATSQYSCAAPDIGADGEGFNMVGVYNRVFPQHRDVHSFGLSFSTTFNERGLATNPAFDYSDPSISSTSGFAPGAFEFVAGWAAREIATGTSSVETRRLSWDGANVLNRITVAGPSTTSLYFDVEVSSQIDDLTAQGYPYIVAYDDRPSNETDAFIAICRGGTLLGSYELQVSEHADRSPNQNDVRIIASTRHFLLGYEEKGSLHMTSFGLVNDELGIVERRLVTSTPGIASGSLVAAEAVFGSSSNWGGMFVWANQGGPTGAIQGAFATPGISLGPPAGVQYCYGTQNSTGERGFMRVRGNLTLTAPKTLLLESLPPDVFGYYLASLTTGFAPNAGGSMGTLCVGGSIGRFGIFQADGAGQSSRMIDPASIPQPGFQAAATAGDRWNFQVWHRDAVMGTATSNFTNAVTIPF